MNRKITRLMSVCIGMAFCAVPVMGQEKGEMQIVKSVSTGQGDTSAEVQLLRAAGSKQDSIIAYSGTGEKLRKQWRGCHIWVNNAWEIEPDGSICDNLSDPLISGRPKITRYYAFEYLIDGDRIYFMVSFGAENPNFLSLSMNYNKETKLKETRNPHGDLTQLEYGDYMWKAEYNQTHQAVSINSYWMNELSREFNYEYLPDGIHITLFESYSYDNGVPTLGYKYVITYHTYASVPHLISTELYQGASTLEKHAYERDDDGDIDIFYNYTGSGDQWILDEYNVYYYSDHTGNEAVEASAPTAYAYGGALYIQSPRAEQVTVYSITGAKVYEGAVQAGTTTVNAARLPKGVYVVAFGDGTRQKVANN